MSLADVAGWCEQRCRRISLSYQHVPLLPQSRGELPCKGCLVLGYAIQCKSQYILQRFECMSTQPRTLQQWHNTEYGWKYPMVCCEYWKEIYITSLLSRAASLKHVDANNILVDLGIICWHHNFRRVGEASFIYQTEKWLDNSHMYINAQCYE